ncbi:ubiquitin-like modifier-activating enzyme ATG7 [Anthonomus grandis grandis]|uniref:ubiquitin-like modifier-activating enzyme ATG7 n=1 Tax=Anthonomus grandis grandis TaxID=2921223 RepID=UPI0021652FA1|nr:ubiquitin-like modifier-activating enzyme ATG7 [Anthonomus grandis grandis]
MCEKLTYVQVSSSVNPSFWSKLTELKLNVDKLDETERDVWGYFSLLRNKNVSQPMLEVDSTSFNESFTSQNMYIPFKGKIFNKNTIENFKECNKMDLLNAEGINIWDKIVSGEALKKPFILNSFIILSFADLKKYHYFYWFAYPVPYNISIEKIDSCLIGDVLKEEEIQLFFETFTKLDDIQKPYFLFDNKVNSILPLAEIKNLKQDTMDNIYFVFFNTSNCNNLVGSQVRNFVALIIHYCPFLQEKLQKLISLQCHREGSKISIAESTILTLKLPKVADDTFKSWVGWEKNERDKMGPKMANMKNTLDPLILAENAIDLNLKLMKWRVLPDIDLDRISRTKCLLLGAGTLGCSVARSLLAWGVREITFVDNSTVSFSNPVRQSLFTYEDSVQMRPKAEAAAQGLKRIFPGVKSQGVQLNIPMPGHSVGESMLDQIRESVETLIGLIEGHDVIFLLMDSRESRWLPTMLGSVYKKIVINAALGFDSYLVMRHGCHIEDPQDKPTISDGHDGHKVIQGYNLGCYFCNDVTAPGDSMRNRTLDQQCTVTRPGVSQIAGALAVELAVSLLEHQQRSNTPAFYKSTPEPSEPNPHQCILGMVPHSIRGFLSTFSQILPATLKYEQCVACSRLILDEYRAKGFDFLLAVFNSARHLEDVAKLTDMFADINLDEILELSDDASSE